MNESRDRRWAFHRIRQPDVEWNLGGFSRSTDHEQNTNRGQQSHAHRPVLEAALHSSEDLREIERAKVLDHQEQSDEKTKVADAVDDERLFACRRRRVFRKPESD